MNEANLINQNSKLFGFLSEKAQQNRFSVTLNRLFKEQGDDAMIIPMNIRPDDFYYTVSGLRKAQLNGVAIGEEYRHEVLELLDGRSEAVRACGFCDIVLVNEGKLYGDIAISGGIIALLQEKNVETLAILGSGALAKAVLLKIHESPVKKVVLFNDRVESCMELIESLGSALEGIEVDIERASEGMSVDFSGFDAALNASPLRHGDALSTFVPAPLMIDLGSQESLFKMHVSQEYMGYDDILPYTTRSAYTIWMNHTQEKSV